jgi:hypothetical protein
LLWTGKNSASKAVPQGWHGGPLKPSHPPGQAKRAIGDAHIDQERETGIDHNRDAHRMRNVLSIAPKPIVTGPDQNTFTQVLSPPHPHGQNA